MNDDPLLIIQEALYCGNYCNLTQQDKDYHVVMVEYPYPVKIVELLDYSYNTHWVNVIAIVQLDDGDVVGVKAQVCDATGTYWEPPDYTTDYREIDADLLRQEVQTAKLERLLAQHAVKKIRAEIYDFD